MDRAHLGRVREILFTASVTLRAAPSTRWEDAIDVAAHAVSHRSAIILDHAAYRDAMERYRAVRKAHPDDPKHLVCTGAELAVAAELVEQQKAVRAALGLPSCGSYRGRLMVYLSPHSGVSSGNEITVDEAVDALAMLRRLGITPDHMAWIGQVDGNRSDTLPLRFSE